MENHLHKMKRHLKTHTHICLSKEKRNYELIPVISGQFLLKSMGKSYKGFIHFCISNRFRQEWRWYFLENCIDDSKMALLGKEALQAGVLVRMEKTTTTSCIGKLACLIYYVTTRKEKAWGTEVDSIPFPTANEKHCCQQMSSHMWSYSK